MKKILALILAFGMMLTLVACGGAESSTTTSETAPESEVAVAEGLTEAIAEQPILLTPVGQSADVQMVKTMLDKNELTSTISTVATSAELGDAKTLILAVGGSSKGLGAAGIDADQELERVVELIDAADEAGLTIIAIHIGGEARRGDLSDKFIEPSFEKADYAIVVKAGDQDGMMAGLASEAGIPIDLIDSMTGAVEPLKKAFK